MIHQRRRQDKCLLSVGLVVYHLLATFHVRLGKARWRHKSARTHNGFIDRSTGNFKTDVNDSKVHTPFHGASSITMTRSIKHSIYATVQGQSEKWLFMIDSQKRTQFVAHIFGLRCGCIDNLLQYPFVRQPVVSIIFLGVIARKCALEKTAMTH